MTGFRGHLLIVLVFMVLSLPFPAAFVYVTMVLGTGFIYGVWMGTLTVFVGITLGLCSTVALVRYAAEKPAKRMLTNNRSIYILKRIVDKSGYKAIILIRSNHDTKRV